MIWIVFIGVLVVVLLYILWQLEQIGKTNKSLKAKLQARDQELLRLQQAAFQLAEQQKATMEQQLLHTPLMPVLSTQEMQLARLLCVSLPVVVKECCSKAVAPHQVMLSQLKRHSTLSLSQLEQMMQKHSRLTTLWRNNSVMSHVQLCSVVAALAAEDVQAKASSQ
jgi:hypothetical protein